MTDGASICDSPKQHLIPGFTNRQPASIVKDVIWTYDLSSNRFSECSHSVQTLRGFSVEEVLRQSFGDMLTPAAFTAIQLVLKNSIAAFEAGDTSHEMLMFECEQVCKDGNVVITENAAKLVKNPAGRVDKITGVSRDITRQKITENTLRETENRNKILLDAIPDMLFRISADGVILDYKAKSESELYVPPEVFLDKNVTDVLPPNVAELILAELKRSFQTKAVATFSYEMMIGGKLSFYEARGMADPQSGQAVFIIRDVTENTLFAKELKREHEFAVKILESMSDAFIALDKDGICTYINSKAAKKFNIDKSTAYGKDFWAVLSGLDIAPFRELVKEVIRNNSPQAIEEFLPRYNRWFEINLVPNDDGVIIFYRDISGRKKNEYALEYERTRLSTLIDAIPDMIWLKDLDGVILACNEVYARFLGRARDEVLGKNANELQSKEQADASQAEDAAVLAANAPIVFSDKILSADGSSGIFQTIKKPMYDSRGSLIGVLGIAHDISALRKSEENLSRLSMAIMQTADTVFITNREGEIEYANDSLLQIYGYTREELIGQNPRIFKSGIKDTEYYRVLWNTLIGGESFRSEIINKSKEGIYIYEDRNITPLKNEQGIITHFLSVGRDITERKVSEVQLAKNERRFSNIIQTAFDGFLIVNVEGYIVEVNEAYCNMSGFSRKELCQMKIGQLEAAMDQQEISKRMNEIISVGHASFESVHIRKNGVRYPVEVRIILNDYNGVNFIAFLKDITEQKKLVADLTKEKERAEKRDRDKNNFLSGFSYELGTPVAEIFGIIRKLEEYSKLPDIQEHAAKISSSTDRIKRTLDMITLLLKLETESEHVEFSQIDLMPLLQQIVIEYESIQNTKKIPVKLLTSYGSYIFSSNAGIIKIIIDHILNNAIKFTKHGSVSISVIGYSENDEKFYRIIITDTGIGMAPDVQSVVFDAFDDPGDGLNRLAEGRSIGLTLVKKYVDILGGRISVSGELGMGTSFTIDLPVSQGNLSN